MTRENIERSENFRLKTFGNTLNVVVGIPDTKSKRISLKKLSFDVIVELSNTLSLSKRKTKILCTNLRENLGKNMVDTNITLQMEGLHDSLSEFYDVVKETFISGDEKLTRSLVFVKNKSDLILHTMNERGLDPYSSIARISVDSGQGFLKCVLNVFDPLVKHSSSKKLDDAGVKRSIILSLVKDVSEHNGNLNLLIAPLRLEDVKYSVAFDLKCGNSLFGLSSHSGKFACLWCEGECLLESGVKRTFGSIDINYKKFVADGCRHKKMKEFKNCVSPRILYLDEPSETFEHSIPPPELHLFIGIISMFVKILIAL
ncbi:uncharacterized protein LOC124811429 isoform X2 [Hydra vulgaris]|nr:uncharacterized protein LOC124811429 isoform X2 [Hydra vulgaris]